MKTTYWTIAVLNLAPGEDWHIYHMIPEEIVSSLKRDGYTVRLLDFHTVEETTEQEVN